MARRRYNIQSGPAGGGVGWGTIHHYNSGICARSHARQYTTEFYCEMQTDFDDMPLYPKTYYTCIIRITS